jgi:hypothetical protein
MGNDTAFGLLPLVAVAMVLAGASAMAGGRAQSSPPGPLVLLTRDGCANTATMRTRLDAALDLIGASMDYSVIDADTLADGDVRRGYGTPTILYDSRDVFSVAEPTPPLPSPT